MSAQKVKLLTNRLQVTDDLHESVPLKHDKTCPEGVMMWLMAAISFTGSTLKVISANSLNSGLL